MSVCYHLGVSSLALLEHSKTIHVVQLGPSQSFLRKIGNWLLIFLVQQNNEKWEIFFYSRMHHTDRPISTTGNSWCSAPWS